MTLDREIKSQPIRLLDVFVIGPVMIVSAHFIPKDKSFLKIPLALFGLSTIVYNARNYLIIEHQKRIES